MCVHKLKKKMVLLKNIICVNKRITYDYVILKKYELGLVLFGWEVKSIRCNCSVNLKKSYVLFLKNNLFYLDGVVIEPTSFVDKYYCSSKKRQICVLLNTKEVFIFKDFLKKKGATIIPIKLYWKLNHIKVEVGLCLGKKVSLKTKEKCKNTEITYL